MAKFLEMDYIMIEKHDKLIEEQYFLEKIQALILRFDFYFHTCVFFVSIFFVQIFLICYFHGAFIMLELKIENPFNVIVEGIFLPHICYNFLWDNTMRNHIH
jgi:hypothetical protein